MTVLRARGLLSKKNLSKLIPKICKYYSKMVLQLKTKGKSTYLLMYVASGVVWRRQHGSEPCARAHTTPGLHQCNRYRFFFATTGTGRAKIIILNHGICFDTHGFNCLTWSFPHLYITPTVNGERQSPRVTPFISLVLVGHNVFNTSQANIQTSLDIVPRQGSS